MGVGFGGHGRRRGGRSLRGRVVASAHRQCRRERVSQGKGGCKPGFLLWAYSHCAINEDRLACISISSVPGV